MKWLNSKEMNQCIGGYILNPELPPECIKYDSESPYGIAIYEKEFMILDESGSFSKEVFKFALHDEDARKYTVLKNGVLGILGSSACGLIMGVGLGMFIKKMNGGRGIL